MREIKLEDLNSREAWEEFIVEVRDAHLEQPNCYLSMFGRESQSYLVIDMYKTDTSSTEFFFNAQGSADKVEALMSTLTSVEYSLAKLLERLRTAPFTATDGRERFLWGSINVVRSEIVSN